MDQFIEYFKAQKRKIELVEPIMYRKVLYATALDPLARAAFGTGEKHRTRIVKLVSEIAHWEHAGRVSLPQLALSLKANKLEDGALYKVVNERLIHWPKSQLLRLETSPLPKELLDIATSKEEIEEIEFCKYQSLFYTYRNNLAHEFREPGYGFEMSNDGNSPYYHTMSRIGHSQSWELVFPVGFFAWIYAEAVDGLAHYLSENDIEPYSQFEFGSRWQAK